MAQHAADHVLHPGVTAAPDGHIDVETAAGLIRNGLGRKIRVETIGGSDGFHHRAEGHGIVRSRQRIRVMKIDLVLSRPLLVVGRLRLNTHPLQCQADLPADILTFIIGRYVHIGRLIIGNMGGFTVFVLLEQVEFQFRAEEKGIACRGSVRNRLFQNASGVVDENLAGLVGDGAEHSDNASMLRAPGQYRDGRGIRAQKQVGMHLIAKALDGGSVNGDSVREGALQLVGHNGNILVPSQHVTEGKPDKLHIFLLNKLDNFLRSILHTPTCFLKIVAVIQSRLKVRLL